MAHMSNRERIARAAEEARLAKGEREAKKTASKDSVKAPAAPRPKRAPKAPQRMKVIWEVCNGNGKVIQTFAYPDKAAAEAATDTLSRSKASTHILRQTKVPME